MLSIHSHAIDKELATERGLKCMSVDAASVIAAQITDNPTGQGCTFPPEYAIAIQPAEDIVVPFFVCKLHYNSFKLSVNDGLVGLSPELLN